MELKFDPYSVLGVSPTAKPNDIKRAYRRLARRLHPDANPNHAGAALQFQEISSAYNLLSDPIGKQKCDDTLAARQNSGDTYFTLRVTPSKRAITPMPEEQVIYLLAEIYAAPQSTQAPAVITPINLTLVLDQSNSMKGARIEKVKAATQRLIDDLSKDDIISVITFNDRANVIIPASPVEDKAQLKARVGVIGASASTEIFQGLQHGIEENRKYLSPKVVNHVLLLTDGNTYGDEERCLALAETAATEGIALSTLGLGHDWNDEFLEKLVSPSGGSTTFIKSASGVVRFFNDHVRSLTNAFAERIQLCIAPDPDVTLEMAFKLSPNPKPLELEEGVLQLGSLQANRPITVLLQFQLPANMKTGFRNIGRLVAAGSILQNHHQFFQSVSDISIEITRHPMQEEPPAAVMDALSKLTLFRMQERARSAVEAGDIEEATRQLEYLATRLFELGQATLATATLSEIKQLSNSRDFSDAGKKTLRYSTRALVDLDNMQATITSLLEAEHE